MSARSLADKERCDRSKSSVDRHRGHANGRECARFAAVRQRVLLSLEILKEAVPIGHEKHPRALMRMGSHIRSAGR